MEFDDETFKTGALWVGGIVAAIVVEALLAKLAQRCLPGLFPNPQPQPTKVRR
jgi:hypothetical protein